MMPLPAKGEICAVMLFGSRARGDHTPESDIDILLCLREGTPSLSGEGNLSISIYPKAQLLEMAERLLGSPLEMSGALRTRSPGLLSFAIRSSAICSMSAARRVVSSGSAIRMLATRFFSSCPI